MKKGLFFWLIFSLGMPSLMLGCATWYGKQLLASGEDVYSQLIENQGMQ